MGRFFLGLAFAGALSAQTITEVGAAAAGGATGGAAGKQVSSGINKIFGKIDQQTSAAAKTAPEQDAKEAVAKTSGATPTAAAPGEAAGSSDVPKTTKTLRKRPEKGADETAKAEKTSNKSQDYYSLVPPPPPIQHAVVRRPVEAPVKVEPDPEPPPAPAVVPPPPPVTIEDLRAVTTGTPREDVLKIGQPASRITMYDDGHLSETYRYSAGTAMLGVVRLSDGLVTAVELR
jgi:hypothetical protein